VEDIYDIKPIPVFFWRPPDWLLWLAIGILALILLGLYFHVRRRRPTPAEPNKYLQSVLAEIGADASQFSRTMAHRVSLIARRFASLALQSDVSTAPGPELLRYECQEPLKSALVHIAELDNLRFAPDFQSSQAADVSRRLLKSLLEVRR